MLPPRVRDDVVLRLEVGPNTATRPEFAVDDPPGEPDDTQCATDQADRERVGIEHLERQCMTENQADPDTHEQPERTADLPDCRRVPQRLPGVTRPTNSRPRVCVLRHLRGVACLSGLCATEQVRQLRPAAPETDEPVQTDEQAKKSE